MSEQRSLSREQWLVLIAAFLGWMFDGLEMGLFSVVARPALQHLLDPSAPHSVPEGDVQMWIARIMAMFLAGAAAGGLLFGWLGDRIGRVRSMALSILAYSGFTGLCYFVTDPWQLGILRFLAALGMGGEWALGVALVVECWPEKLRPLMAGIIGAAGNVGYLAIGTLVMTFSVTPDNWRWTMVACATPAVLAFLVMAVLPESKRWQESVAKSNAKPIRELFTTRLVWPTLLATAFASVALIGTWGCVHAFLPSWADQLANPIKGQIDDPYAKGRVLVMISIGAIIGCLMSPIIGGRIGRRPAYFGMCAISLVLCLGLFLGLREYNATFLVATLLVGAATASFYGWLPLYLPELFPTRVRATGQGLCFNFGRIFAIAGVLTTKQLMTFFDDSYPLACAAISSVYVIGMLLIWLAPETKGKPLPE